MQLTTIRRGERRRFGLGRRERGATIVLVSLSMVVLLGMAAVSIDFAVASDEKATVQNAADQAVLALATDCSLKKSTCLPSTATYYAQQNAGPSASVTTLKNGVAKAPVFDDGKVTVRITKDVKHTFARVLGDSSSTVRSDATATWNTVPLVGTKLIPIGLPYCDWLAAQPGSATSPGGDADVPLGPLQHGGIQLCRHRSHRPDGLWQAGLSLRLRRRRPGHVLHALVLPRRQHELRLQRQPLGRLPQHAGRLVPHHGRYLHGEEAGRRGQWLGRHDADLRGREEVDPLGLGHLLQSPLNPEPVLL